MIKNILITGVTSGLGYALAKKFADLGCKVYGIGRNQSKLDELAAYSSNIIGIVADINDAEGRALISHTIESGETISIIHNAAAAEPCVFGELTEKALSESYKTNCISPILLTQSLLTHLQEGQRVLNITSGAAKLSLAGLSTYCVTKGAFEHMISCMNEELNPANIFCGNVRPGMVDTPLQKRWREEKKPFPNQMFYINAYKEDKLIQPEVAAKFISWVLLETDNEAFKNTEWNIYEELYQMHWLGDNNLYHRKDPRCSN
jgi:benzil reductase ((S)-benzoin forming)